MHGLLNVKSFVSSSGRAPGLFFASAYDSSFPHCCPLWTNHSNIRHRTIWATIYNLRGSQSSLKSLYFLSYTKTSLRFMKTKVSVLCQNSSSPQFSILQAKWIQSTISQTILFRSLLVLHFHLHLDLPRCLFLSRFLIKFVYIRFLSVSLSCVPYFPSISLFSIWSPKSWWEVQMKLLDM
jgi:hypothetical protein